MTRTRAALVALALALLLALVAGWAYRPAPPPRVAAASRGPGPGPVARSPAAVAPEDGPRGDDGPAGPVECELLDPLSPFVRVEVVEVDPDTLVEIGTVSAEIEGGWVRFTPRRSLGLGQLHVRLHRPATIAWAEGTCLQAIALERLPSRAVAGTVEGPIETGAVAVQGRCGPGAADASSDAEPTVWSGAVGAGGAWQLEVPIDQGPCAVRATRVFGGRDLLGPWVTLGARPPALALPVPAGVGWGLLEVDDGLRVVGVEPGGAAARAGLRVGDLLVTVGGDPAADLDAAGLVEEEGPVSVEFLREGERRSATLR